MRPSFAHIDAKEEAKRKKLANPEEAADTKVKKEESTSEEASKIQVRVLCVRVRVRVLCVRRACVACVCVSQLRS
jgi:hypothetical protein